MVTEPGRLSPLSASSVSLRSVQCAWLLAAALAAGGCCGAPVEDGGEEFFSTDFGRICVATSYPIWGLPRDVIDVPFTGLNRIGLGSFLSRDDTGRRYVKVSFVIGQGIGGAVGIAVWMEHGYWAAILPSYAWWFGSFLGLITLDLGYGYVVNPLQVALLRTGVDTRFVKRADHLPADDPDAGTAEERERSRSFFPNWRYLVWRAAPEADAGPPRAEPAAAGQ